MLLCASNRVQSFTEFVCKYYSALQYSTVVQFHHGPFSALPRLQCWHNSGSVSKKLIGSLEEKRKKRRVKEWFQDPHASTTAIIFSVLRLCCRVGTPKLCCVMLSVHPMGKPKTARCAGAKHHGLLTICEPR